MLLLRCRPLPVVGQGWEYAAMPKSGPHRFQGRFEYRPTSRRASADHDRVSDIAVAQERAGYTRSSLRCRSSRSRMARSAAAMLPYLIQ